jgi:hypothetical protein
MVRDPYADGPTNPFWPETSDQTNQNGDAQEHTTNTKNSPDGLYATYRRTVCQARIEQPELQAASTTSPTRPWISQMA